MKAWLWSALFFTGLITPSAWGDLGRLHPKYEGTYDVTVRCATDPCGLKYKIDRAVLMDEGNMGIRLNFVHSGTGVPVYLLLANRIEGDGLHIEADAFQTNMRAVEWAGDIDPRTGAISGRLRDGALVGDLIVEGKPSGSPGGQYQPQPVTDQLSLLDIQGDFKVSRSFDGGLTLRSTLSGRPAIVGTWRMIPGARIDFNDSEFFPASGVLVLYHRGPYGALKWTIALRRDATGAVEGDVFAFSSSNAKSYRTTLKR